MSVLLIPGLGGSGAGHWQRWWLKQDPTAALVEQVDWDRPDLEAWIATAAEAVEENPGAILVAHSLGCALVAHLTAARSDLHIGGALLVAPADVDDRNCLPSHVGNFGPLPLDRMPFRSIVVGSSNDPFVSIGRAMMFAYAWGSRFIHLRDSGHINVASGFGAWPDGLRLVRRLGPTGEEHRRHFHLVQASASGMI